MLVPLSNTPRAYAWGSADAIAALEGREPSGAPEAEVWFGDHAGDPAELEDGSTLDAWIAAHGAEHGVDGPLPYLLKLLAAGSPLSIQAHPSLEQARRGFAREEATGIPRDAAHRNYRDANHKPEVIVALSDTFEALAGFRSVADLDSLLSSLAGVASEIASLRSRLLTGDPAATLREAVRDLLSGDASELAAEVSRAVAETDGGPFADDVAALARLEQAYPGDPGVGVALLLNRVVLSRGEAIFVPAGVPHAYLSGLGVELMAASDNVLRGGLTPKHIDVPELVEILDASPAPAPLLVAQARAAGVDVFEAPVSDFSLTRVRATAGADARIALAGPAIALATAGAPRVGGAATGTEHARTLAPGRALFVTPDEGSVLVGGAGEVFLAQPGALIGS
ncbi:mannose-6-phosphate isomerase, class I [Microbacterium sp. NPDC078428]|uniref:mannose-6-phosphate isomerase, class I n=1 Tax=Microbacterium sp. NPDC078428 TaxID=3364190 RepID=UPI0037C5419D